MKKIFFILSAVVSLLFTSCLSMSGISSVLDVELEGKYHSKIGISDEILQTLGTESDLLACIERIEFNEDATINIDSLETVLEVRTVGKIEDISSQKLYEGKVNCFKVNALVRDVSIMTPYLGGGWKITDVKLQDIDSSSAKSPWERVGQQYNLSFKNVEKYYPEVVTVKRELIGPFVYKIYSFYICVCKDGEYVLFSIANSNNYTGFIENINCINTRDCINFDKFEDKFYFSPAAILDPLIYNYVSLSNARDIMNKKTFNDTTSLTESKLCSDVIVTSVIHDYDKLFIDVQSLDKNHSEKMIMNITDNTYSSDSFDIKDLKNKKVRLYYHVSKNPNLDKDSVEQWNLLAIEELNN